MVGRSVNGQLNGDHLPPPSTLAAQLVRNHDGGGKTAAPANTSATFGQLLQEILRNLDTPETDTQVNYKLIQVVTEAGLDVLSNDNPFAQFDTLLPQARDSLSVIISTIQRQPELLFFGPGTASTSRPTLKLLLWLYPKILRVAIHPKCRELSGHLSALQYCMFRSLLKTFTWWPYAKSVLDMYFDCLDEIANIHVTTHVRSQTRTGLTDILVPPARSVTDLTCGEENGLIVSSALQLRLTDMRGVVHVASILLSTVSTILEEHSLNRDIPIDIGTITERLLDDILRLNELVSSLQGSMSPDDIFDMTNEVLSPFISLAQTTNGPVTMAFTKAAHGLLHYVDVYLKIFSGISHYTKLPRELIRAMHVVSQSSGGSNTEYAGTSLDVSFQKMAQDDQTWNKWPSDVHAAVQDCISHYSIQLTPESQRRIGINPAKAPADVTMREASDEPSSTRLTIPKRVLRAMPPPIPISLKDELFEELTASLADRRSNDLTGLANVTKSSYAALDTSEKGSLWESLKSVFCVLSISFNMEDGTCRRCDGNARLQESSTPLHNQSENEINELVSVVRELLNTPDLQHSQKHRVMATLVIRSIVLHNPMLDIIDLTRSEFGEWCMRALNSSTRELRRAASHTLVAFLRQEIPARPRDNNRRIALEYLRTLSDRAGPSQIDSVISAWGQVAIVCGERELNLALLRLVDYLGHPNSLVCALASEELDAIARAFDQTPQSLFKPYWKSIAVTVVQDLLTVPQKCKKLAGLLGTEVPQFLKSTELDTLPTLVLTKKKDVLKEIAAAHGETVTVQDVCLQPRTNLAAILALLLSQPSNDIETTVMNILAESVPKLAEIDLVELVRLDTVLVVTEMLKAAGDEDAEHKPRVYQAIQTLAILDYRKSGHTKGNAKQSRMLASFFEDQVLGIMTLFSDMIEKTDDSVARAEKVRCLHAIKEMITIARTHINIAVPQIRACLQSAIDQEGLADAAMSAWLLAMRTLEAEEVVQLLDQLFAVTIQHWTDLSSEIQQQTYDTIAYVLKTHSSLIRDSVITVPSLAEIPLMSKFEAEITRLKELESVETHLVAFAMRLRDENASIVLQSAQELRSWLENNQSFIHESAISEPPRPVISTLARALLDSAVKYNAANPDIADKCAQCLGLIGCLDPNHIEANIVKKHILVLSNFDKAAEVVDWVAILFENVLVPAFKSTSNARAQGFLAFVMQDLLRFSGFNEVASIRLRASQSSPTYQRWIEMSESTRNILTPFLTSRYALTSNVTYEPATFPVFNMDVSHGAWLRAWVLDMLRRPKGDNAFMIFPTLARVIKGQDLITPTFLLPYVALNIVLGGTVREVEEVAQEMLVVLSTESTVPSKQETIRQCSQNIFAILDYMSRWAQTKKQNLASTRVTAIRAGHSPSELNEAEDLARIESVEKVMSSIPANIIAQRAIECGSYARALFHWEQFIREQTTREDTATEDKSSMYGRLQTIYSQIDEPDGLDGIAAQLNILTPEQQALQHRRAGRWAAAQSWYEIETVQRPQDEDIQLGLLSCLRDSGQYNQVIRVASDFSNVNETANVLNEGLKSKLLSLTAEASWMTDNYQLLKRKLEDVKLSSNEPNLTIGQILLSAFAQNMAKASEQINELQKTIVRSMSSANTSSLQACHGALLHLHVLSEMRMVSDFASDKRDAAEATRFSNMLDSRLAVLGSYIADKQYVLGIRRAMLQAVSQELPRLDLGASWMATARLARKANIPSTAHFAVLRAASFGDDSSKIEQARLLWKDGQHRQAIRNLEGAIASNMFVAHDRRMEENSNAEGTQPKQNVLVARAQLLLAKWLDASGQTQAHLVTSRYQVAARTFPRWDKGHYYLGKHYNKLLEAEKALPPGKQSEAFLSGEATKLVIENYLRSIPFGTKYWFQTIPKILTLWLDLGMDCVQKPKDATMEIFERRKGHLELVHKQLKKYFERTPPYIYFNALPQMISRISHPNDKVFEVLSSIIQKIASAHPSQALWSLLPVAKATQSDRAKRGLSIINKLKDAKGRPKSDSAGLDLRTMVMQGQKLQDGLLQACEIHIEGRATNVSLSRDLQFNHKLAPSPLVVPFQFALTPNVPTVQETSHIRLFKAFAQDRVTIASFSDEVLVLSSLQRPRKLTARGSDGKLYGLLCKPKDDLRKDQRLMEFNTMINRALKRDVESSKRRLYIKTYGVTPLSEESGTIEWVEGIKPLRDILLKLYQRKGIQPNYTELRTLLGEASSNPANVSIFTKRILPMFPSILYEWFIETFPEPDTWFAARLRYARSAAVMSIVGHVLGLGDRHGENILLEEGSGGVFHVDFNCLFDKGLTFEKPELVPFRLTPNMVDAMGCYGSEGPFRKSAELTLRLLRQHSDTLMNILETFVHDPTADFIGKKKRITPGVPDTPQEVLDSVEAKLRGFLRGESVPLSVEGHVDALVKQATDHWNLCRMYIGWCAFL